MTSGSSPAGGPSSSVRELENDIKKLRVRVDRLEMNTLLTEAQGKVALGQFAQAADVYVRIATLYPESPDAVESLYKAAGFYNNKLKQYNRAIDTYKLLIDKYSGETKYAMNSRLELARCHQELGNPREAMELYKDIARLTAENQNGDKFFAERAYYEMGELSMSDTKPRNALDHFDRVIRRYPDGSLRPAALYRAASIRKNHLADTPEAVQNYERILQEYATSGQAELALIDLAKISAAQNDDTSARSKYEDYLRRFPSGSFRDQAERYLRKSSTPLKETE